MIIFLSPHLLYVYSIGYIDNIILLLLNLSYLLFISFVIIISVLTFFNAFREDDILITVDFIKRKIVLLENGYIKQDLDIATLRSFVVTKKYSYGSFDYNLCVMDSDGKKIHLISLNPHNKGAINNDDALHLAYSLNKDIRIGYIPLLSQNKTST